MEVIENKMLIFEICAATCLIWGIVLFYFIFLPLNFFNLTMFQGNYEHFKQKK